MVFRYVSFFAFLLVYEIMLTDMVPLFSNKFIIVSIKLGKKSCIFMNFYLLAHETPASGRCFNTIILGNELNRDSICENESKVPCLVLLGMDCGGDGSTVLI